MKKVLTRHAKKRMRQRSVGSSRVAAAARKTGRYRGKGIYRSEVQREGKTYVVAYKLTGGKKVVLSTWKK